MGMGHTSYQTLDQSFNYMYRQGKVLVVNFWLGNMILSGSQSEFVSLLGSNTQEDSLDMRMILTLVSKFLLRMEFALPGCNNFRLHMGFLLFHRLLV